MSSRKNRFADIDMDRGGGSRRNDRDAHLSPSISVDLSSVKNVLD